MRQNVDTEIDSAEGQTLTCCWGHTDPEFSAFKGFLITSTPANHTHARWHFLSLIFFVFYFYYKLTIPEFTWPSGVCRKTNSDLFEAAVEWNHTTLQNPWQGIFKKPPQKTCFILAKHCRYHVEESEAAALFPISPSVIQMQNRYAVVWLGCYFLFRLNLN